MEISNEVLLTPGIILLNEYIIPDIIYKLIPDKCILKEILLISIYKIKLMRNTITLDLLLIFLIIEMIRNKLTNIIIFIKTE